ncbi:MAG: galactose mutarotase [Roseburia sp.]|nr:galactose mutarotase [Roseburia sp.]
MKITKSDFGTTNTGENIYIYHLENAGGAYVEIINFGCRLVKIVVPDRNGNMTDVCLGFSSMDNYANDNASLGAVVGRVANRIKDGSFSLHGKTYQLAVNNGTNHLHGGLIGYGSKAWEAKVKDDKLILTLHSEDGEEGYPGNLTLSVTYGWSEDNELSILYEASTDADTLLNVTSHGYFNLNGEGSGDVLSHELFIDADQITELDDSQAPTGTFLPVDGTPFDFRTMHTIGKLMHSDYEQFRKFGTYDHNFVINGTGLREAAVLQSKESGIRMTCFTDQPGLQLYVANQPIELPGKDGKTYERHTSVCLETQHFPDAINHENFPSIVLEPEAPFRSKTLYHFSTF